RRRRAGSDWLRASDGGRRPPDVGLHDRGRRQRPATAPSRSAPGGERATLPRRLTADPPSRPCSLSATLRLVQREQGRRKGARFRSSRRRVVVTACAYWDLCAATGAACLARSVACRRSGSGTTAVDNTTSE